MPSNLPDRVARILRGLSIDDHYDRFQAQTLNAIAKADLDGKTLRQIVNVIQPYMDEAMEEFWNDTQRSYDKLLNAVNDYYPDMGPAMQMDYPKLAAINELSSHYLGDYADNTLSEIGRAVRRGARYNRSVKSIADEIRNLGGISKHNANAIARTHGKGISRAATWEKAKIAEVEWFDYYGIRRKNTRPFCSALIGQTLHIKRIRQLRNGNKEPVETYGGGWRCHHDLLPNPFYVGPEDDGKMVIKLNDGQTIIRDKIKPKPDFAYTDKDITRDFMDQYGGKNQEKLTQWMEKARWQRNPYRRKDLAQDMRTHGRDFGRFNNGTEYTNYLNRLMEDADQVSFLQYQNRHTGELTDELVFWNTSAGAQVVVSDAYELVSAVKSKNIFKMMEAYKQDERTIWL